MIDILRQIFTYKLKIILDKREVFSLYLINFLLLYCFFIGMIEKAGQDNNRNNKDSTNRKSVVVVDDDTPTQQKSGCCWHCCHSDFQCWSHRERKRKKEWDKWKRKSSKGEIWKNCYSNCVFKLTPWVAYINWNYININLHSCDEVDFDGFIGCVFE